MRRPIDVIFKHPVSKFTVIYQNGKLWQLPRLEFDGNSLRHKRPYTGSREQIFVAQDQSLPEADLLLRSQLATLPLPATVTGKNADEFERWWQQNSYECRALSERAYQQQAHAKALLSNPATPPPSKPSKEPPLSPMATPTPLPTVSAPTQSSPSASPPPNTVNQPQPPNTVSQPQSVTPSTPMSRPDLSDFDDIFGDMMADLTKDLGQ